MKKFGRFMLGSLGLIIEALIPVVTLIISILLTCYVSFWFAFTFIVSLPLSLYLIKVICDLDYTDKFLEWTFGVELGD